jgi:hypothetical protein
LRDKDDVERYLEDCSRGHGTTLTIPPDAAKRVKDELDMHAVAGARGWVVFALADGTPLDHTAYDSWNAAVKAAKWNRDRYIFAEIQPDGCPSHREAAAIIHYARTLSRAGFRIPSPDWEAGPLAASMPHQPADRRRMIRQLVSGRPLVPEGYATSNLPAERGIPAAFRKGN